MFESMLDHVAIAVRDMRASVPFVMNALGLSFLFAGDQDDQGFRWAQFGFAAGGKLELVTPTRPDSFLQRFLRERGEGVHHVTLKVGDIGAALDHFRARQVPLVNVSTEHPDWKEAFIHPRDGFGTLFQIAEPRMTDAELIQHHASPHPDEDHRHIRLEDLLADEPVGPGTT